MYRLHDDAYTCGEYLCFGRACVASRLVGLCARDFGPTVEIRHVRLTLCSKSDQSHETFQLVGLI